MADDDCSSGKSDKCFLKKTKRAEVKIVCRLIEQEDVATMLQYFRENQPTAFPSTQ